MAGILQGALIAWRELASNYAAALTMTSTTYTRSGHVCLGAPTVTVDPAFPLSNLLDRRLSKVCRLICTPAQDVGTGGNNNWYYKNIQINLNFDAILGPAGNSSVLLNTMGLLDVDVQYPSVSNYNLDTFCWPGGPIASISMQADGGTGFGSGVYSHILGTDAGVYNTPRAAQPFTGYRFPNHDMRCFSRASVSTLRFTLGAPTATTFIGSTVNPGTAYVTIGRAWAGDSIIVPEGSDAFWKFLPIDPSIVRRSRGQQIYTDQYTRLRSLAFSLSNRGDTTSSQFLLSSPYNPSSINSNGYNGDAPSFLALQLEAGISNEVFIKPRLSWDQAAQPYFGYSSQLYGTIAPPGVELADQSGGYTKVSGTLIESR